MWGFLVGGGRQSSLHQCWSLVSRVPNVHSLSNGLLKLYCFPLCLCVWLPVWLCKFNSVLGNVLHTDNNLVKSNRKHSEDGAMLKGFLISIFFFYNTIYYFRLHNTKLWAKVEVYEKSISIKWPESVPNFSANNVCEAKKESSSSLCHQLLRST